MARILIVDDDPAGRELLATLARYRGHEPLEAADGREALDMVRAERPQLVISDILMPTMDGYEFVRRLRAEPGLADTRVIFYTASYHEQEALRLAESGQVARVLIKPCEPSDIISAIEDTLQGSHATASPTVPETFDTQHLQLLTDKLWHQTRDLEAANAKLGALTELLVQLASERDPKSLLEHVCHGARKLFGARYAVLLARDKRGNGSSIHAMSGLSPADEPRERPALEAGALGRVYASRKPWRIARDDGMTIDAGLPSGYPRAHAYLAVPLVSLTHSYGWVCLADKVGADGFTDEDESLFGTLGAQVGRIYENGSLYLELERRARQLQAEITERERATQELGKSEERFRQLAENIQDAFFLATGDLPELLYLSPAYSRIWGRERPQSGRISEVLLAGVHPDDAEQADNQLRAIAAGPRACEFEYRVVRPDGSLRWILVRTFPVAEPEAVVPRIVGTAKDITDRKAAAARIEQLNRVYAVLSSINTLIVRVGSRDELFRESCRLAVEQGKFELAWIGWLDPTSGAIPPIAWAGLDPAEAALAVPRLESDHGAEGMAATAIRSGQPQVCNDITADNRLILFRDEMRKRGYHSIIALPLFTQGRPLGCMVLTAREKDFFNEEELRLLTELAGDISFALDHLARGEQLYHLAYYDALTGLANRTLFLDRLSQRLAHAQRHGQGAALVVMAPERLSDLNDTFGRPAGDTVLALFARRLAAAVGTEAQVARVTGDQLATVVDQLNDETELLHLVRQWQEQCFGEPFEVQGAPMRLGATTGIALFPEDGHDAPTLLKNAEAALERAKATGDEHLFYTQRMSVAVTQKFMLEHALREAQQNHEFELHYQPKVDVERRKVTGVEALIRWNNRERGLVSPATFIPLMENTGMIVQVGAWVIRQAAEHRKRWREMKLAPPRVAVNVSTVQLRRRDFLDTVRLALQDAGKAPGIDFEVTESLIMEDSESNIRKLDEARRMGIGIALDDFGTGFSSLGYLARLPVETLKIDRSFIAKMLDDPGTMTLVSTMISLAHSLKLSVVAEGVETEEQAKILRLLRCDEMQGYLISKPLSFDAMTEYLRQA